PGLFPSDRVSVADRRGLCSRSEADEAESQWYRPAKGRTGSGGNARPASAGPIQEQGRPLCGRAVEEESWKDGSEVSSPHSAFSRPRIGELNVDLSEG